MNIKKSLVSLVLACITMLSVSTVSLSAAYEGNLTADTEVETVGSGYSYANTHCGYRMYIVEVDENGNPKGIISDVKDVAWCGTSDCNEVYASTAVGGGTTQAIDNISNYSWLSGITKPIDGSGSNLYAKGAVLKAQLMANNGELITKIIRDILLHGKSQQDKDRVEELFNSNKARLVVEPTFKLTMTNDWSRSYRADHYTDSMGLKVRLGILKGYNYGTYYGTISELLVKYNEAYSQMRRNRDFIENNLLHYDPILKDMLDAIRDTGFDTDPYNSYYGMNLSGGNMKSIIKMVGPGSLVLEADDVGLRAPANPSITDGNLPYLSLTAQNGGYGIGVFKANGQSVMIEIWRDVLTSLFL